MLIVPFEQYRLFMGRKQNLLRHRVDKCEYDLEQTLLGTLFFTVNFFLFPTTSVYYFFFTMSRIVILILHAILTGVIALVSHAPFATLWIWFFQPERLPGGIYFEVDNEQTASLKPTGASIPAANTSSSSTSSTSSTTTTTTAAVSSTASSSRMNSTGKNSQRSAKSGRWSARMARKATYFRMVQRGISLSAIFFQYAHIAKVILTHYKISDLVMSGFSGQPVKASPPLRYPNHESKNASSIVDFLLFLKLYVSRRPFHVEE
eukprot:TRINITY_DN1315_c3_g1_i1.p1 TRINITY_DN1315_c3_g1~~TRINITY_DN1315_c3_g1_i1.p1  ORF type:complete len:262 (-),score=60.43 TRINITY_DN1315_c3_g1_i1:173-958(-)